MQLSADHNMQVVQPTTASQIFHVLRRQMVYIDAETGDVIGAQGGEQVPDGRVFLYGYDVQAFCGIDVPGLEDAMTAKPPSRLAARGTSGDAKAPAKPGE